MIESVMTDVRLDPVMKALQNWSPTPNFEEL
jgi:hypothetical protein